jgi:hypothetical protein
MSNIQVDDANTFVHSNRFCKAYEDLTRCTFYYSGLQWQKYSTATANLKYAVPYPIKNHAAQRSFSQNRERADYCRS